MDPNSSNYATTIVDKSGDTTNHVSLADGAQQRAQSARPSSEQVPISDGSMLPPVDPQISAMLTSLGSTLPVKPLTDTVARDDSIIQPQDSTADAQRPASGVNYDSLLASLSPSATGARPNPKESSSIVVPDSEPQISGDQAAVTAIPFETDVDHSDTASQTNAELDKLVAQAAPSARGEPLVQSEVAVPTGPSPSFAPNNAHALPAKPEPVNGEDESGSPDENAAFEQFLNDEREYVLVGNWEQFPHGSRLFIGKSSCRGETYQLISSGDIHVERVSKRDVFHVFHKYGKLAQISLKQAYGFVQFITADECRSALLAEQGRMVKGRKISRLYLLLISSSHTDCSDLEISKPQKNRNDGGRDRARSPGARQPHGVDRYTSADGGRGDRGRGGRRERDDYRPGRASPPASRNHGDRDRYGRRRSRSPAYHDYGRSDRYRDPLPPRREQADEDDELPLPRRLPRDVPDVQIIVIGELDRNFIGWVERCFIDRGVRVDVLLLSPRMPEAAVIRRQIIEGVLAVSKVDRMSQQIAKIPLQVFDRRSGADVRFEQYADLEPLVAAEVVLRAKATSGVSQTPSAPAGGYGYGYGYGAGSIAQAAPAAPAPAPVGQDLSKLIGSMDSNGLQQLLGAMQQQGQIAPPVLTQAIAAQAPVVGPPQGIYPPPAYGQSGAAQQPDMANILAQLSNYRQR